jgi:predicted nucleotidyltransferase
MKTVGIIAEYNPFHNGHKYHIEQARNISGADKVLVVMSGSFVQRGEPACADKFTRALWALRGGADMVIELPDVFSLSNAERFAGGAVRILAGTGLVDSICFGSECADIDVLKSIASKPIDADRFTQSMKQGRSYASAFSEAAGGAMQPNDILAVEYIRAVEKYAPGIETYAAARKGSAYGDNALGGEFSSAAAIRKALMQYAATAKMAPPVFDGLMQALPKDELEEISKAIKSGSFPSSFGGLSDLILYGFRTLSSEEAASLPEVSEGLENLFSLHAGDSSDAEEMLSKVKSKRYTMARLKRICMYALLGITRSVQESAVNGKDSIYARVLGVKASSIDMISELKAKASIPVIIQAADRSELKGAAKEVEAISSLAHAVRALGQPYDKSFEADASHRLIVLK